MLPTTCCMASMPHFCAIFDCMQASQVGGTHQTNGVVCWPQACMQASQVGADLHRIAPGLTGCLVDVCPCPTQLACPQQGPSRERLTRQPGS